jgi:hypothetical protein
MLDGERLALKIVRAPRRLDLVDELPRLPSPGVSIQDLYTQPFCESTHLFLLHRVEIAPLFRRALLRDRTWSILPA